jgi:hypothetical protein
MLRICVVFIILGNVFQCWCLNLDPPYVVSNDVKSTIIQKYSTRNYEAEDIREMEMMKQHSDNPDYVKLRKSAKDTYSQVIPCLRSAWMMNGKPAGDFHKWKLPNDAEEHFEHLKNITAKFRKAPIHEYSNYEGPWIENIFIEKFLNKPLSYFNGFIPLFVQWIDSQILRGRHFDNINDELSKNLRSGVIYLAISQGDVGLGKIGTSHPNILVLSAGGYGHVPIPLVKGEKPIHPIPNDLKYSNDATFFGNMNQMSRPAMFDEIQKAVKDVASSTSTIDSMNDNEKFITKFSSHADDWEKQMIDSRFNFAPRGYGRSSFRYAEIIQMGRIPIFLWDDIPWIPYQGTPISIEHYGLQQGLHPQHEQIIPLMAAHNYHNHPHMKVKAIEVEVSLRSLIKDLKQLKTNNKKQAEMLKAIADVRYHFTYDGVIHAIEEFIADPFDVQGKGSKTGKNGNYLRCTKHPRTERCCDETTSAAYAHSVHPYDDVFHSSRKRNRGRRH